MGILDSFHLSSLTGIFERKKSFLGLDIGNSSIKIVELRKKEARAVLETYGELDIAKWRGERNIPVGEEMGLKEVMDMVQGLLREARVGARHTVVGIPVGQSFIVPIELPSLTPQELASAIPFEARRFIPVPLEEVFLDWRPLSPPADGGKGKVRILLIATPKAVVSSFRNIAEGAGLSVMGFEMEPFSIVRSGLLAQERRGTLIFDFGSNRINIILMADNHIEGVHSLAQGSIDLVLALSRSLSVSQERAEELMRFHGISRKSEEREIGQVLSPLLDRAFLQAQRISREFTTTTGKIIERIFVTGGGSRLAGLTDYLAEVLGFEVRMLDSFRKVAYPPTLEPIVRSINPSMSVACGLALKGFEL